MEKCGRADGKTQDIVHEKTGKGAGRKRQKIFKKCLTHTAVLLYDNQAPARAQSAMMREIAQK